MPPSGYTPQQSGSISGFLASCANALRREGMEKSLSPMEALRQECRNIEIILSEGDSSPFAENVLNLTASFYQRLLERKPSNFSNNWREVVESVLEEVRASVLAVHVPEIGMNAI